MSAITRTWLGFAALGAGIVHLALVVGSPLPLAIVLIAVGAAEFAWGALTFARDTPPLPVLARVVVMVPVVGWALIMIAAGTFKLADYTDALRLIPMTVATVFDLVIVVGLTRAARHDAESTPPAAPPKTGRYLLAALGGALVVGALTTPALAATEAGAVAQPHGNHSAPTPTPSYDFTQTAHHH